MRALRCKAGRSEQRAAWCEVETGAPRRDTDGTFDPSTRNIRTLSINKGPNGAGTFVPSKHHKHKRAFPCDNAHDIIFIDTNELPKHIAQSVLTKPGKCWLLPSAFEAL